VDARVGRHVLAHVVNADIHQFHCIGRGPAEMRRGRGVAGAAGEGEVNLHQGEGDRVVDGAEWGGVPGERDVHVLEGAELDQRVESGIPMESLELRDHLEEHHEARAFLKCLFQPFERRVLLA
jgi:hypothetical protein